MCCLSIYLIHSDCCPLTYECITFVYLKKGILLDFPSEWFLSSAKRKRKPDGSILSYYMTCHDNELRIHWAPISFYLSTYGWIYISPSHITNSASSRGLCDFMSHRVHWTWLGLMPPIMALLMRKSQKEIALAVLLPSNWKPGVSWKSVNKIYMKPNPLY